MFYPVTLEPDSNGTLLLSFKDLPWVNTFGNNEDDALARAVEALDTAIDYLMRQRQPIPAPSRGTGLGVKLSAMASAKVALHNMMLKEGVTKAELKRRMQIHGPQVDRLLDTRHVSRLDEVERAFEIFGHRVELTIRPDIAGAAAAARPRRPAKKAAKRSPRVAVN